MPDRNVTPLDRHNDEVRRYRDLIDGSDDEHDDMSFEDGITLPDGTDLLVETSVGILRLKHQNVGTDSYASNMWLLDLDQAVQLYRKLGFAIEVTRKARER